MEDLLCPECRDRVKRKLAQRGESNRKQLAYSYALEVKHQADELMRSLEMNLFDP